MVNHARCLVYRPQDLKETVACLADARSRGLTVGHRGTGLSYGDLALNEGGAVLDMSGVGGIADYDRERGTVTARSGCTFDALWRATIADGWWPPVVPGTSHVTLGGAVAADVHGKNHLPSGSFGEHVTAIVLADEGGIVTTVRRADDPDRLGAIVGSLGLACTILEVSLQLKKVHAGFVDVEVRTGRGLQESMEIMEEGAAAHEYSVAWLDCFPRGASAGRSVIHFADHLPDGHELAGQALSAEHQSLPNRVLGVIPAAHGWRLLQPMTWDLPMRAIGIGKFAAGKLLRKRYVETHARFHFLLDHLPGWQQAYLPGGLIQYQMFVAREEAPVVFRELMRLQRRHGVYSYLAVMKRHRASPSPSGYALDGYSLALDFPVRSRNVTRLTRLVSEFETLRMLNGGRLYAAKDAVGRGIVPSVTGPVYSNNLSRRWSNS